MRTTQRRFEAQLKRRADRFTDRYLMLSLMVGLLLAPYYGTWLMAIGVGGCSLVAYYSIKRILPDSRMYQYVLGAVAGIFMAQYIYQMHGMFEMHFFAFIGSAYLVVYQNWRLQIPLASVVLLHHAVFGYLQYVGAAVRFTELDFMPLHAFVIHILLAAIIFLLCGYWAHIFQRSSRGQIVQSFEIGRLQEANRHKETLLRVRADLRTTTELNKDITDSIRYTQRLQHALLPEARALRDHFAGAFVFDRPHSIVGGDFIWYHQLGDEMLLASVDCTGHGVPGAFMTIVAVDLLNKIVRLQPDRSPAIMLQMLDAELSDSIGMQRKEGVVDGMDMALCRIHLASKRLIFAGAMSPIVLASPEGVKMYKGSRYGIGGHIVPQQKEFTDQVIPYDEGDMLYMFSDGYIHQFGGANDKKLGAARLLQLIGSIHLLPDEEQQRAVTRAFEEWKGARPQTDDSLFAGFQLRRAGMACSPAQAA